MADESSIGETAERTSDVVAQRNASLKDFYVFFSDWKEGLSIEKSLKCINLTLISPYTVKLVKKQ